MNINVSIANIDKILGLFSKARDCYNDAMLAISRPEKEFLLNEALKYKPGRRLKRKIERALKALQLPIDDVDDVRKMI